MNDRRASRFALEVLFLVALAVGVAVAELRPLVIGGVMLAGWIIVALFEWAASREQPHYGSGLPPRYYVPQVALPPRRPLEQVGSIYPASERRDEAPTWIAPPDLRQEVVGAWPVAPPHADAEHYDEPAPAELPVEVAVDEVAREPVPEPAPEPQHEPEPQPEPAPEPQREPEPQPEPDAPVPLEAAPLVEPEPEQAAELVVAEVIVAEAIEDVDTAPADTERGETDAGVAEVAVVDEDHAEPAPEAPAELPARGGLWRRRRRSREPQPEDGEPAAMPEAVVVGDAEAIAAADPDAPAEALELEDVPGPEIDREPDPAKPALPRIIRLRGGSAPVETPARADLDAVAPVAGVTVAEPDTAEAPAVDLTAVAPPTARHRLDPLPDSEPRRWPWKRQHDPRAVAEVPARPTGVRVLPGRLRRR